MTNKLPNFLVCGAAKSGTTTVHEILRRHPNVFMPTTKEPHYFVAPELSERIPTCVTSAEDYAALFAMAGDQCWRGEASVFYLYHHESAIPRILHSLGADIPVLIVLRNPVDRAYSAYLHAAKYNPAENLSFEAALEAEADRMREGRCSPMLFYRSAGKYSAMVAAYQQAFPRTRVLLFDDLVSDPGSFTAALLAPLELEPVAAVQSGVRENVGGRRWSSGPLGSLSKQLLPPRLRAALRRRAPDLYRQLRGAALERLTEPAEPMPESLRRQLTAEFADDVRRLSTLIGRNLDAWLDAAPRPRAATGP